MKTLFGTLLTVTCLFVTYLDASSIFSPFPDNDKCNLSLVKWAPTPFRVQYHGFVESSKLNRYIFLVNGEIVYLQPNEVAKQQFSLKQILLNGQQVLVEDMLNNELYILEAGIPSYIPNKFECVLLEKTSKQRLVFSDTKNRYKTDNSEILVSQKNSDLHVWTITKGKEPLLCVFPIATSK